MGIITDVISQHELDVDYNAAKIAASPFDYVLTKRILCKSLDEFYDDFNIFEKTSNTEKTLAEKLGLEDNEYIKINPNILNIETFKEEDTYTELYDAEQLGLCGTLIDYNHLYVIEDILLKDFEYATGTPYRESTVKDLKNKFYLKALETWHLKATAKSSLIPNLMYLCTEFWNMPLISLENLEFAQAALKANKSIVLNSYRDDIDDSVNVTDAKLLDAIVYLIPKGTSTFGYEDISSLNKLPQIYHRLGLCYAIIYGCELLYYYENIKDFMLKDALADLLSIGHDSTIDTFCNRHLYTIDTTGEIVINPEVVACFDDNNEVRFNKIRDYFTHIVKEPDMNKEITTDPIYYTLPIFFMRMVGSMHSYAYQICRVKHATLLYTAAKDKGVIDKDSFDTISDGSGICGTGLSSSGDDESSELLNLSSTTYTGGSKSGLDIEKEKAVPHKRKEAPPTLAAADAITADLKKSPYDYDIDYIKNDLRYKDSYNTIASSIKLITHELTKQIKEIRTYNSGGKQSGLLVGKLDKKNLYKYKQDPHIFYNNSYKLKEMDLAFGCILDESGSMGGEKIKNGRIVMIMLHEVLNSLGINHGIIGHTSRAHHHSRILKYYQFKEEAHYSLEKPYNLICADARSGNCDSGALYYMHSVIKQVRNKDKIVIIFSDGEPTECTGTELIKQVSNMERDGIHVIGVGINFSTIKEYYPDNANGRNLKEMTDIVVSILKRYVLEKKD